jgi:hypothetical protein
VKHSNHHEDAETSDESNEAELTDEDVDQSGVEQSDHS